MKDTEAFRDQLYNTDTEGRRVGFFPKRPKGSYYFWRKVVSYFLLIIFFVTPWIELNDQPLFLFNFIERKFILFGVGFWPQDIYLFVLTLITTIIFIIGFTVVLGRIWCGWTCPQTIFLEMVYRRIEYWIEGDAAAQRRLSKAPWSAKKVFKRVFKHTLFLGIAFWVSNTVMMFFIGKDDALSYFSSSPAAHPITFLVVMINTGVFYFVFSWFREQACILLCPYGRLQGVLLDGDSLVINYDYKRGEPRGKIRKDLPAPEGDCIDCKQCIAVCPTGIDIRNGIQLECVNCTACIDACDEIMTKVDKPTGLIRYATQNQIETGEPFKFTLRIGGYAGVIGILLIVLTGLLLTRGDLEATIMRAPGQTFSTSNAGIISNVYTVKLVNKTQESKSVEFRLKAGTPGTLKMVGGEEIVLDPDGVNSGVFIVDIPADELPGSDMSIGIEIYDAGALVKSKKTSFVGPLKLNFN